MTATLRGEIAITRTTDIRIVRPAGLASILAGVAISGIVCGTAAAQDRSENGLQHGTYARPIERKAPRYPISEQRRGRQGWVALSYCVTTDGMVIDPIVDNSSGSRAFEREARQNALLWRFEPATWNGEPVEQCHTRTMVSFVMHDALIGTSARFISRYKKIQKRISSGDLEDADSQIDAMFESNRLNVYEVARLWMLRGNLAHAMNDKSLRLSSYRKAVANSGKWIEKEVYASLLKAIVILELEANEFSSAIRNFERLAEMDAKPEMFDELSKIIQSVKDAFSGEDVIAVPAQLSAGRQCEDCSADWQYGLLRRRFGIVNIQGSLDNLEIRCEWKRVLDVVKEDVNWIIPEDWGECHVIVFGEKGTSFSFVEFPSGA